MNIHQANNENYLNFLRLFSKDDKSNSLNGLKESFSNISGGYNGNTIEDILSGNVKNSYGVSGMDITGKSGWQKIIPVSDSMIQQVIKDVKKDFYEYGGKCGNKQSEHDAYSAKLNAYYRTLDVKDRVAAAWTLDQMRLDLASEVKKAVQEQNPKWQTGQPIDSKVLDKIFAEEKVTSKYKNATVTKTYKGINTKA